MPTDRPRLRILVIEDSPVVGPFTAHLLEDLGYEIVGPVPTMALAREHAEREAFDAALLDVHIRGERVFPLCELLADRDIPFVFTSGYADWGMPERWEDRPRLQKPYTIAEVDRALTTVLRSASIEQSSAT
jgi:CheY-like chemotaxis protein